MTTSTDYRICARCVMDTSDADIIFDAQGVCDHCHAYERRARRELLSEADNKARLEALVHEIKTSGQGKRYDCLIGVSGGVDSTYVAYLVRKLGLRPLAVHFDNGWNSELAVKNIEQTLRKLDIDLYTFVVDWEEFKDVQLSLIKAAVANIEAVSDHAIMALLFRTAAREGIRYIISGGNVVTEAVMPKNWMHDNRDWRFIRGIHRRFGSLPVKTLPHCSLFHYAWLLFAKRLKYVPILNYVNYVKADAKALLQRELGWRDYGGKHYESIITRFFQAYILPRKFKMDKRRPHLATLILSGQMTREEALQELERPPYQDDLLRQDMEFFRKKMNLTADQFEAIMSSPVKTSADYPSNDWLFQRSKGFIQFIKKVVKPASLR